jgi:NAD(P)-dependent dehydrogenase (short-subunit alcohol dehydrogenase family)
MEMKKLSALGLAIAAGGAVTMSVLRNKRRVDFQDKVVFITGGSRGLGLLLAQEFIGQGAKVAICARDADELEVARDHLSFSGATVKVYACDVSQRAEVEETVRQIEADLGPVDVLINNAGIITLGPLEAMVVEDFEREMSVHFGGQLYATFAVLPSMRARKTGRIVNISSIGGRLNTPHLAAYNAAKFASAGLSQSMRIELQKDNIYVTTVFPFLMRVGSFLHADVKGQHQKEWALGQILDSNPLATTTPDRTARAIVKTAAWGDATLVPSNREALVLLFAHLFPNLTQDAMALANRFMPGADGPQTHSKKGFDSTSKLAPSVLTRLNDEAALRNNELASEATCEQKREIAASALNGGSPNGHSGGSMSDFGGRLSADDN